MQRRQFLAASAAAATGLIAANRTSIAADGPSGRPYFELRRYHFANADKQKAYEQFLAETAIPAYNRAGVTPVGVFKIMAEDNPALKLKEDSTDLYVFLPHKTFESVVTFENRLGEDEQFQRAGKSILAAPKSDPAFKRYESTLLLAMEGSPMVMVPAKNPSRVFELRTYESRTNAKATNKLAMFNAGEFQYFKDSNMPGVFYGNAIVGERLPQLTYMVVHESRDVAKKNWDTFGNVPAWKKLAANPNYQDNVSKISDEYVRPSAASQI
ncbi:MAG TPA: NIPSNAP family protein [Tepidisphaeraceae bacterium]|jgi:hypothetical protein